MGDAANIASIFRKYHADGDGSIGRDEMKAILMNACGFSTDDVDEIWTMCDANSDDRVNFEEFAKWIFCGGAPPKASKAAEERSPGMAVHNLFLPTSLDKVQAAQLAEAEWQSKLAEEERRQQRVDAKHKSEEAVRPNFLPTCNEVTPRMKEIQKSNPEYWSLQISHWFEIIRYCKEDERVKREKRVNMHKVNSWFTIPWTKDTGCGLSVLRSGENSRKAQLMFSHAWKEGLSQLHDCVEKHQKMKQLDDSITVWFCCFAQYQCEDGAGPTIENQLALDPFAEVIKLAESMLAIHTTAEDLYSRLWCVFEINCAIKNDVPVDFSVSEEYAKEALDRMIVCSRGRFVTGKVFEQAARIKINTAAAACSSLDDYEKIVNDILNVEGGFEELDDRISKFRRKVLTQICLEGLLGGKTSLMKYAWREVVAGFLDALSEKQELKISDIPEEWWSTGKNLLEDAIIVQFVTTKDGMSLEFASKDLQNTKKVVWNAVKQNGNALKFASEDLQNTKQVVLAAVEQNGNALEFASQNLKDNTEVVLKAVNQDGKALQFASIQLRANRQVVAAAIKQNRNAWEYASEELRVEKERVLVAIRTDGMALKEAPEELKADKDVVLEAVKVDYKALQDASEELRADKDVVLVAVNQNPRALQFAAQELRADKELVLEAIKLNVVALRHASTLRVDRSFMLEAVALRGRCLEYCRRELKADEELVRVAVKQNGCALQYASKELRSNKDVVHLAVKQDYRALSYAPLWLQGDAELQEMASQQEQRKQRGSASKAASCSPARPAGHAALTTGNAGLDCCNLRKWKYSRPTSRQRPHS